jgi:hypothetical protein
MSSFSSPASQIRISAGWQFNRTQRADRVRGGLFVNRTTDDMPEEIRAAIQSLVVKG